MKRSDNPNQILIAWGNPQTPAIAAEPTCPDRVARMRAPLPDSIPATTRAGAPDAASPPLVQRLPWDFISTFPQPTPEAIDGGVISDEDATPENVRAIHEEHAHEAMMVLHELDVVLDARRRGVHPGNNKVPMLKEAKARLEKFFETEPGRLERWWQILMDTYEQVFGPEATDAFTKALRARHAGIPVTVERPHVATSTPAIGTEVTPARLFNSQPVNRQRRVVARLPVPKSLPSAIAAGRFGREENGKPVRPGAHEVREITERHAEKLIDILDSIKQAPGSCVPGEASRLQGSFDSALDAYAEDFGQQAADQLEAYVRRQASLAVCDRADQGSHR